MGKNSNFVSLAGEWAVLPQLSARGCIASPTLGNTKDIDILVFPDTKEKGYRLEVKTSCIKSDNPTKSKIFGKCYGWGWMNKKHENNRETDFTVLSLFCPKLINFNLSFLSFRERWLPNI